jgi:competence protein ComEC
VTFLKGKKHYKTIRSILYIVLSIFLVFGASGCVSLTNAQNSTSTKSVSETPAKESLDQENNQSSANAKNASLTNGQLKIHYIDVGQGDSILVQQGNQNMLIDTGTNASTDSLISYLKSQNITKLDYLVLTHPHEDHIGGADVVIKEIDIGTLYMTKYTTTTKTYKDMISIIKAKRLKPIEPALGSTFKLGDANCVVWTC